MLQKILLQSLIMVILASCAKKEVIFIEEGLDDVQTEQYIVVLKKQDVIGQAEVNSQTVIKTMDAIGTLVSKTSKMVFTETIQAGVFDLNEDEVQLIRELENVQFIEKDDFISVNNEVQFDAPYNLDRLDQQSLPLNGTHIIVPGEAEVNAYVIDTGVRVSHEEFGDRSRHGFDFVDNDSVASDCNGHGTHVAGTLAGNTYGVAKNVKVYGVRVLGCSGGGRFSDVIAGIEWVTKNHIKPAVANMSLGGGVSTSIDQAVEASIAEGISYVVAAGNDNRNACNFSPARVSAAITVGSTDQFDDKSSFSNFGECVDIFAPGTDIQSAWSNGDSSLRTISGTSMASPLVAGVVANYLSQNPDSTPAEVKEAIINGGIEGKISGLTSSSPNLLVSNLFLINEDDNIEEPSDDDKSLPEDNSLLVDGSIINDLSALTSDEINYQVRVQEGESLLRVSISGGSGDADLYLQKGNAPTVQSFDCRPFTIGNEEFCEVLNPLPGVYHIMVRAYSSYRNLSLLVKKD